MGSSAQQGIQLRNHESHLETNMCREAKWKHYPASGKEVQVCLNLELGLRTGAEGA
jgi:hypothetical protein